MSDSLQMYRQLCIKQSVFMEFISAYGLLAIFSFSFSFFFFNLWLNEIVSKVNIGGRGENLLGEWIVNFGGE